MRVRSTTRSIQRFRDLLFGLSRLARFFALVAVMMNAGLLDAQKAGRPALGVAWRVVGTWQIDGKGSPLQTGDAIRPGSLLQPVAGAASPSITVLLPDGQGFYYDCFTAADCARGFRVPSVYRQPEPFAIDLLARIRAVLAANREATTASGTLPDSQIARDEAIAVLGPGNKVQAGGMVEKLPNGHYTYDLRPLDHAHPRQFHLPLEKTASSITLSLPAAGLYAVTIMDDLNTPRIDLFIAAMDPAQAPAITRSYREGIALIKEWDKDYSGWPVHEFRRAYLQSLMMAQPQPQRPVTQAASTPGNRARPGNTTAEPTFSPRPGVFDGPIKIALHCATPGATLHYAVDGTQPLANSPVYGAPIVVKGSELTIKVFASAPGKKDSPVVTGIFRIRGDD